MSPKGRPEDKQAPKRVSAEDSPMRLRASAPRVLQKAISAERDTSREIPSSMPRASAGRCRRCRAGSDAARDSSGDTPRRDRTCRALQPA